MKFRRTQRFKQIGMTLRGIILFSFHGLLLGNVVPPKFDEIRLTTVDECCQDGRIRGSNYHDCGIIPLLSSSHMCRIAQEQCCSAAKEKLLCYNGIIMAQGQGACEVPFFDGEPWEAKLSKICCDCCTLGLMMVRDTFNCDFRYLFLNAGCWDTARECCLNKTEEVKTKSMMADPEVNVTAKPPVDCTDSPCSHFCKDNGTCGCFKGFQLKNDGVTCEDINECLAGTHNCFEGLACVNTEGSFLCQKRVSCGSGFVLIADNKCEDLDECKLGIHNCGANFLCTNTPGSFECSPVKACPAGFIEDGPGSCVDVNECVAHSSPCQSGETCMNTEGSFMCRQNTVTCGRGYHLSQDGTRCEDINECQTGNVCGDHGCFNLVGTYRCECRKGFYFNDGTKLCEDVNECRYYQGLCAHNCENTEGSYRCSCTAGFQLSYDGVNCEDLDECLARPCSQTCANVYGSYRCYCHPGYLLSDADGMTCEDVDECALPSGGHACSYSCSNIPGSYYCSCPPTGYVLAPNGQTCQDIDECSAGIHTCSASESCFNIQGGFRCLSFTCPENFHEVARGHCKRVTCKFTQDPASCFSLPLSISFYNISFPINTPVPANVFRMGPSNSVPGDKVLLTIVSGDKEGYFGVEHQAHGGEIFLRRAISQPRDFSLTVEFRLTRYGNTHFYMANIALFVTNRLSIQPSRNFPSRRL